MTKRRAHERASILVAVHDTPRRQERQDLHGLLIRQDNVTAAARVNLYLSQPRIGISPSDIILTRGTEDLDPKITSRCRCEMSGVAWRTGRPHRAQRKGP